MVLPCAVVRFSSICIPLTMTLVFGRGTPFFGTAFGLAGFICFLIIAANAFSCFFACISACFSIPICAFCVAKHCFSIVRSMCCNSTSSFCNCLCTLFTAAFAFLAAICYCFAYNSASLSMVYCFV